MVNMNEENFYSFWCFLENTCWINCLYDIVTPFFFLQALLYLNLSSVELGGMCFQGHSLWIEIPKTVSMWPEELKPREPPGVLIHKAGKRNLSQALHVTGGFGPLSYTSGSYWKLNMSPLYVHNSHPSICRVILHFRYYQERCNEW